MRRGIRLRWRRWRKHVRQCIRRSGDALQEARSRRSRIECGCCCCWGAGCVGWWGRRGRAVAASAAVWWRRLQVSLRIRGHPGSAGAAAGAARSLYREGPARGRPIIQNGIRVVVGLRPAQCAPGRYTEALAEKRLRLPRRTRCDSLVGRRNRSCGRRRGHHQASLGPALGHSSTLPMAEPPDTQVRRRLRRRLQRRPPLPGIGARQPAWSDRTQAGALDFGRRKRLEMMVCARRKEARHLARRALRRHCDVSRSTCAVSCVGLEEGLETPWLGSFW